MLQNFHRLQAAALIMAASSACSFSLPAAAQQPQEGTQMYQCTALEETGGYEEPSLTSPPARLPNEQPRLLKKDDSAYTGIAKGAPVPAWIELYGALEGHGSSSMGYFQSEFFKCVAVPG